MDQQHGLVGRVVDAPRALGLLRARRKTESRSINLQALTLST
jgi:hypothetical protein